MVGQGLDHHVLLVKYGIYNKAHFFGADLHDQHKRSILFLMPVLTDLQDIRQVSDRDELFPKPQRLPA